MKRFFGVATWTSMLLMGSAVTTSLVRAESPLNVVYPPPKHKTIAEQIFFIGTGSPDEPVSINGKEITNRSKSGNFAPSLSLNMGENTFVIRQGDRKIRRKITRISSQPEAPQKLAFAPNSLTPAENIARLPNEPICLGAIATPNAQVSVQIGVKKISLTPQTKSIELPTSSSVLTDRADSQGKTNTAQYLGCTTLPASGSYGRPTFTLQRDGQTTTKQSKGKIEILAPEDMQVVEVIADSGTARTGATTNHSRLTPLPKGSQAGVTGKEGEWLRLDYGAWIKAAETKPVPGNVSSQSIIRGVASRRKESSTEIVFPLQKPVPVEIKQKEDSITLTLHNLTAQTDTIRLDPNPLIKRLDWQQVSPTQVDYTFELHERQQWGYDLRYQGSNLILSLRHPPKSWLSAKMGLESELDSDRPLQGITILLDPGHGGEEAGAKGPTGYPEKKANLIISKLLETELKELGAKVYLTRREDRYVSLEERVAAINKIKPDLALSIHHNALPDDGDAENTRGISTFWYNTQAHAPGTFLHQYLVKELNRPDAGTFWNNLALTRPHTAPSVLLELGYMIHPEEFELIINEQEQQRAARILAEAIEQWFVESSLPLNDSHSN